MSYVIRSLVFLDKHSGLISAVGLILAAVGLFLAARQLSLYRHELKQRTVESERLAWERILKLLHQVAQFAAAAHLSSVTHSPLARNTGYLPPDIEAGYGPAQQSLLSHWQQLMVELSLMPDGTLVETIGQFIAKYQSADSRASKKFLDDLPTITHRVNGRAQKNFVT